MQNEEGQIAEKLTELNISREGSAPNRLIEKERPERPVEFTLRLVDENENGFNNVQFAEFSESGAIRWLKKFEAKLRRQQ